MDEVLEAKVKLASLTDKQRLVLDLLCLHKSSKEIARTLGISPYTVDQRIASVRTKLGASSRGEVARLYLALREICDESVYRFSHIEISEPPSHDWRRAKVEDPVFSFSDAAVIDQRAPWDTEPEPTSGLEAFDQRYGIAGRVFAVVGLAAVLALIMLAMVSMAKTLTDIV